MTSIGQSSTTALMAAAARAAHLEVDSAPFIFADTLAERLLADRSDEFVAYHRRHGGHPVLRGARAQVVCRARYAETRLAHTFRAGTDQYVILGAGLDSFAYRSPLVGRVRVFEVDQPATQQLKRENLSRAGIQPPTGLTFVPVDFQTGSPAQDLADAGFDPGRTALFSWLGVTMYLTAEAIGGMLSAIGELAPGTELVADFMMPEELRDADARGYVEMVAPETASRGEPWLTFLGPEGIAALFDRYGLDVVDETGQPEIFAEVAAGSGIERADALRPSNLTRIVTGRVR
jgi:methyltransferase (TIGR00027 family)